MSNLMPRTSTALPDILQWFEREWPFGERHPVRIETYREENGEHVIHCELPGMDPERDIHLTVEGNQLKVSGERTQEQHAEGHSEFRYGSFSRVITLPASCDIDKINASYDAGILTIRIPGRETGTTKEIPVARGGTS